MNAENAGNGGCPQRDSAEHEGYAEAHRSFNHIWKERDSAQSDLLEKILYKDNFNRAYKRVKKNHGAPGIDGMTVEDALPYLREHQKELTDRIYRGSIVFKIMNIMSAIEFHDLFIVNIFCEFLREASPCFLVKPRSARAVRNKQKHGRFRHILASDLLTDEACEAIWLMSAK